ncbi:DUF1211 domain-containing protein [Sphingomonas parva]|uniref:DUF1211 domain-containing protein n=1 Tax=Sphingomonas parva TaxID=2555898 RepID=A0A4Y8ZM93_9SPHN|nr:TMEM175 family protein [Sphingomonas parva]TFI56372.1 DUF1211 domain-containing protein [Sphingomonas parva]
MGKGRLEAFSDGVIAIIITIMVLELRAPHGTDWAELAGLLPIFLSYVLSFVYLGIYWNNHHHMLHAVRSVTGVVLWANLHLLFWLSLIPFATAWMDENHFSSKPVALYGVVLLMCAVAYSLLAAALVRHEGEGSTLATAFGRSRKGRLSMLGYAAGIGAAFVAPAVSLALYVLVAAAWFVPDRRVERLVG